MVSWFQPEQLMHYLFVLVRAVSLLMALPLFGGPGVPPHVKVGLGALTALLLWPVVQPGPPVADVGGLLVGVAQELFAGLSMGFVVSLAFFALQVAGHLMDVPIGFGMVNVLDPQFGGQVPILGQFYQTLATLVFFITNGHHAVLRALASSYEIIPLGGTAWQGGLAQVIVQVVAGTFAMGVRIAVPVIAATFLTDVALGIVSRAVPQINVFITGYPIKIAVGFVTLVVAMPVYVGVLAAIFGDGGEMMRWLWQFLNAH